MVDEVTAVGGTGTRNTPAHTHVRRQTQQTDEQTAQTQQTDTNHKPQNFTHTCAQLQLIIYLLLLLLLIFFTPGSIDPWG